LKNRFVNAGSFLPGTSTANYNGTAAQLIAAVNYYNLTIAQNGARVITFPPTGTIGIANLLSLASGGTSYVTQESTLNFTGTTSQIIPAFPFYNLRVDNNTGATFSGTATVSAALKVNGNLYSNGNLTLLSNTDQTALIDGSGTGNVIGNVTAQRYLSH